MAGTVLNIDHHISNTMFGNINMVDTNAAATGELVYQIIKLMGIDLNTDIAECIYTAITADTGCFKYDNTTAVTHGIAGELISIKVESNHIYSQIFNLRTLQQTKMLGRAIDSIKTYHGGKTAIMTVTRKMMRETGCSQEDLDGIVEFARDIVSVKMAALLRETDDGGIKINLRSKEYADTAAIAAAFGGGGHRKASGCTISTSMENAVEQLIKEIEKCYG
jgi:phosphoesterase RecJ-like protein